MVATAGWDEARSIPDVLERMATIEAALPYDDGVAYFNRMYFQVTQLVDTAIGHEAFVAGEFLTRLDVHFGNLFFAAYAADLDGRPVSPAWAPLFEARAREHTHPIQFALAGMNAHINRDLPLALVKTCRARDVVPARGSPQHADFRAIDPLLAETEARVRRARQRRRDVEGQPGARRPRAPPRVGI